MHKKIIIILFVLLNIFSCSESSKTLSPLSSEATILAFGDSLTFGTGAGKNQDYPSVLAKLSKRTVINEGIPGEISSDGLQRLPGSLDKYNPHLLILIHGGNDILRRHSREQMKKNIINMITETQQRNIEVILLGVPEFGIFLSSADEYKDIARETNTPTEYSLLADILGDNSLKSDEIHPNAEGYKKLAEGIFDFLQQHGALVE